MERERKHVMCVSTGNVLSSLFIGCLISTHLELNQRLRFCIAPQIAQVISDPFEHHWLGTLDNLGSNKEIQPEQT